MRLVFFILLSATSAFAQTGDSSPEDLFQKGLAAYQNKQFDQARENFNKLLSQGQVSANLLHNLALTEYQLDQKAMALALWRKALSLQPGFTPALKARELLETQNQMRPFERDSVSLWWTRTMENLKLQELLLLAGIVLAVFGMLWIRYFAQRRVALEDETPMPSFPGTGLFSSILLAAAILLVGMKVRHMATERATVIGGKVNIKSLPSDEAVPLGELPAGSEVHIRRKQDGWAQVQNGDGISGWLKDADVFITSGSSL